jgi:CheY-like chemotaxis protein
VTAADRTAGTTAAGTADGGPAGPAADGAGILLVDDMEDNLVALESVLRPLGRRTVRADSGTEALKALLREEFAVVLLDVVMPEMDGFETAAHIRRLDQTRDTPIVFLTGTDRGGGLAFRGYAAGAVDYLTKPFDPWVLRAKVSLLLELNRRGRRVAELEAELARLRAGAERPEPGDRPPPAPPPLDPPPPA